MNVICDTMIWYGLANESIKLEESNDIKLIATGINIQELSSSENLYKNPQLIMNVLNTMYKHHSGIIEYDPWDYILTFNVNVHYEPISRDWHIKNLNGFLHLCNEILMTYLKKTNN